MRSYIDLSIVFQVDGRTDSGPYISNFPWVTNVCIGIILAILKQSGKTPWMTFFLLRTSKGCAKTRAQAFKILLKVYQCRVHVQDKTFISDLFLYSIAIMQGN